MRALGGIFAIVLALAAPAPALACGGLVSASGGAELNNFQALISHDGATEDVVVAVDYAGARSTGGLAWLLPLPAAPRIGAGELGTLTSVRDWTTPPRRPSFGFSGAAAPRGGGVQELGRTQVGDLEFVTLGSTSAAEVGAWMAAHGFTFRDRQAPAVQGYLDKHWVIVAARVQSDHPPTAGRIAVRFTFPSSSPVYPLAIAGADHTGAVQMTLYVLTPYRPRAGGYAEAVLRPDSDGNLPAPPAGGVGLVYSAPLTGNERSTLESGIVVPAGAWLSRYEGRLASTAMTSDLTLSRSQAQSKIDYQGLTDSYNRETLVAVLLLVLLVVAAIAVPLGVIAGGVALAVVLVRRRRRG